jgi:hypothetical protein
MAHVFSKLNDVFIFFDNIIVVSRSKEAHVATPHEVLRNMLKHNLMLKSEKCHLLQRPFSCLIFRLDRRGFRLRDGLTSGIRDASKPETRDEVASFIDSQPLGAV